MPRHRLFLAGATTLFAAIALWVLVRHWPLPPRELVMVTGPDGNVYGEFGARYRTALARAGIDLRLVPTAGAVENLARLRDGRSGVSVGFVQAGTAHARDSTDLVSLGSVFFEPLWFFHRGRVEGIDLRDLLGRRLSVGPEGSGTRELALRHLALGGIDLSRFELLPLTPEQAGERLARGEIDAAAIVTSFESPVVRRLLANPDITLASFRRADAFLALQPDLEKLVLPEGVGDLARNLPPKDVVLLATKASLVVRSDLDPGLQYLLLEGASEIHAPAGMFHRAGRFPAPEAADVPLSPYARQFYKTGVPWLQRYLPFRLAALLERMLLILIPLAALAYPLWRLLPSLFGSAMRWRVLRLYRELRSLEVEVERAGTAGGDGAMSDRFDELERRANRLYLPGPYSPLLYNFRVHLNFVRSHLPVAAKRVPPQ